MNLDPTVGSGIRKTRPAVVISPNELNHRIATVIIAPMTTSGNLYPSRVACEFNGKANVIVLDRIRTVDKTRLVSKMGQVDAQTQLRILQVLAALFAP
ncbi:MAG: type II toxin-antitoxin system PemK/MazF family toxin [Chloroflexota bacterium]|nr:type II toxin-antitoxin system PemK/MazF family toxin [Chloroflexota bacterium]